MRVNNEAVAVKLNSIGRAEVLARTASRNLASVRGANAPRILITGGAGNVATNLQLLLNRSFETVAFDNMTRGHKAACEITGTRLIQGELENLSDIFEALDNVRPVAVVHAGAYIEVGESMKFPHKFISGNINGGLNLLLAMRELGIPNLLFSNTAAVYDGTSGKPITETDPINPASVYGSSKAAVSRMIREGNLFPGMNTVSPHYFNVFGAPYDAILREDHGIGTETHLVPIVMQVAIYNLMERFGLEFPGYDSVDLMEQYKAGGRASLKVFGKDYNTPDGTCIRDYISMQTMAYFHLRALNGLLSGQFQGYNVFNLGTKTGRSVLDVVNTCEKVIREETGLPPLNDRTYSALGSKQRIIPLKIAKRRPGDVDFLVADPSKANRELASVDDPAPIAPFENDIRQTFWSMMFRPRGYESMPAVSGQNEVVNYYLR